MRGRPAERLLAPGFETRTGQGFDVHRFAPGDHVWLCGVRVPHDQRLEGHSDADVGLHALSDAIYGALAEGDIGRHFPPSDPQWKGAESHIFLAHAAGLVRARGGRIVNADVTLLAEAPKIAPHADARGPQPALLDLTVDEPHADLGALRRLPRRQPRRREDLLLAHRVASRSVARRRSSSRSAVRGQHWSQMTPAGSDETVC